MEELRTKNDKLLNKPEDYLRPVASLEAAWRDQVQSLYNFTKKQEGRHSLPAPPAALPRLSTESLDLEQIWQLVELQTGPLLATLDDVSSLSDLNLCLSVARLSSLAKMGKSTNLDAPGEDEGIGASSNEGMDENSEGHDEEDMEDDSYDGGDGKNVKLLGRTVIDESASDEEEMDHDKDDLLDKPRGFDKTGLDDHFSDDSDNEVDNFDEMIAPEGLESDDSSDKQVPKKKGLFEDRRSKHSEDNYSDDPTRGDDGDSKKSKKGKGSDKKMFKKTSVDTKFFKLRESEWIADTDAIGENFEGGQDDDIDLMVDMSDEDEAEEGVMYDAFFDEAPEDGQAKRKKLSEMLDNDDNEEEDYDNDTKGEEKIEEDTQEKEEVEEERTTLLSEQKKETKSRFELEREKELQLMGQLEKDNLGNKPWYLRGETFSTERPEDSALQQNLDYDIAARQKPVITEDTTSLVERVIMGRLRSGAWDDVERKVKPTIDPTQYKKKLLLDQERSKKSLAEIYEEEYLKQQQEKKMEEDEKEPEEHEEIRKLMDILFTKLNALSNYHYTPPLPTADIKIQSNLPAITVEEATPETATSATLLAPQEILEPVRGELVGKTERTTTDRKRERRAKKVRQRERSLKQNKELAEKLKRVGKAGPGEMDKKTTTRIIEKAVKAGQVKMLQGTEEKSVSSSQAFFKKLQEDTTKSTKHRNAEKRRKNDDRPRHSISKLML